MKPYFRGERKKRRRKKSLLNRGEGREALIAGNQAISRRLCFRRLVAKTNSRKKIYLFRNFPFFVFLPLEESRLYSSNSSFFRKSHVLAAFAFFVPIFLRLFCARNYALSLSSSSLSRLLGSPPPFSLPGGGEVFIKFLRRSLVCFASLFFSSVIIITTSAPSHLD